MFKTIEIGDRVEIIDHKEFLDGKQFTIKNIRKCNLISKSCINCVNMLKGNYDIAVIKQIFKGIFNKERKEKEMNLKIKKLHEDSQELSYNNENAGIDVYTHSVEDCGNYLKIHTGISIEPDPGFFTYLVPRSSIYKQGLMMYNSIGIIDNSYRGEIIGILHKTKDFKDIPEKGTRLMQLVVQTQISVNLQITNTLSESVRGENGFGSSGVK